MKLDLGSGLQPAEGFEGVDRMPGTHHTLELGTGLPWPWADDSIEALRSSHFIEHVQACDVFVTDYARARAVDHQGDPPGSWVDALVHFFNEAFRVVVPGGSFELIWPAAQGSRAFQDPTHRRFIPSDQLQYWNREFRRVMRLEFLGATCNWVVESIAAQNLQPERFEQIMGALPAEQAQTECARIVRGEMNVLGDYRAMLRAVKP